ncbi:hypothetical protein AeMF1_013214 [Aphanomyces euteiches]|nr:hypothetical protein AeMF1_013214 [Aphanomyces euteiches]KAH9181792.1 hypothetical protein AeNC1_016233 [Aphanomyces euteiches]
MQKALVWSAIATAALASVPYRRWAAHQSCLNVEEGAYYCVETTNPCQDDNFGDCPKAGTYAAARCDMSQPSYHHTGPYQGRCVLIVDTVCVKNVTANATYKCAFPDPVHVASLDSEDAKAETAHVASVASGDDNASVETKSDEIKTGVSTGTVIGVIGVLAVVVVAFLAYRKQRSHQGPDSASDEMLRTPVVPYPTEKAPPKYNPRQSPMLAKQESMTPTLLRDTKSRISGV